MKQILSIVAITIALAGFTACKGSRQVVVIPPLGDCCRQTEALRAELPNCCAAMLTGGKLSPCCEASGATGADPKPCCVKASDLIGKMGECCKSAMKGSKPQPCCVGGG